MNSYNIEVIAPASPRQIVRARVEETFLVRETGKMYRQALGPLAEEIRKDGRSIQWVHNILAHKKEAERIVFEDPDPADGFLLVPDPKWKTHPDPLAVPDRAAWKRAPWTGQLACLAICHDKSIGSLRDLRRRHLPLLRNILAKGLEAIEAVYGVERERVRVFVHYVPQFFHFHGGWVASWEGGSLPAWVDRLVGVWCCVEPMHGLIYERLTHQPNETTPPPHHHQQFTSPASTSRTAWRSSVPISWPTSSTTSSGGWARGSTMKGPP